MLTEKIATWLDSKSHVAPSTLDTYRAIMDRFQGYVATTQPASLKEAAENLPGFVDALQGEGFTGTTTAAYVSRVKEFLRFHGAEANGGYRTTAREKKRRQEKGLARWFDEADIHACLAYTFPSNHLRNHLILRILIETGMRVGELSALRRGDADPEARTLFISDSKTTLRHVVISEATSALLKKFMGRTLSFDFDTPEDTTLFALTKSGVSKIIGRMLDDLGLNAEGRGPHTFRHWAATAFCFVHHISLEHIALLLGDTPDTIRENYLHPTPRMLRHVFDPALNVM